MTLAGRWLGSGAASPQDPSRGRSSAPAAARWDRPARPSSAEVSAAGNKKEATVHRCPDDPRRKMVLGASLFMTTWTRGAPFWPTASAGKGRLVVHRAQAGDTNSFADGRAISLSAHDVAHSIIAAAGGLFIRLFAPCGLADAITRPRTGSGGFRRRPRDSSRALEFSRVNGTPSIRSIARSRQPSISLLLGLDQVAGWQEQELI